MSAEQLITRHLDIWTSAHKTRSSAGRGSSNKLDLYGIKKLRELILELAVRGKLVPQDPNDEPASELLKKALTERNNLVKDGKLKKETKRPLTSEEDNIYNYPFTWESCYFKDIGYWAIGNGFPESEQGKVGEEILFCKVSDMNLTENERHIIKTNNTVSIETAQKLKLNIHPEGTVVFPKIGGAIATNKRRVIIKPTAIDNNCLGIVPSSVINHDFLFIVMLSIDMTKYQAGTSVPALSLGTLDTIIIGLPPLNEQKRIVAKVDELMAFCDDLEQAQTDNIAAHAQLVEALLTTLTNSKDHQELQANWQRIAEHFDTLFTTEDSIDQLKQTILQLAVMGKLVPQDPNDEPASELLKKIAAEKAQLIKEGKIKKEKPLPEITDEEKPFEVPEKWRYVRVGTVFTLMSGTTFENERELEIGEFLYVKVGDMSLENNEIEIQTSSRFINPQEKEKRSLIPARSIIFPKRGGAIATNKKRYVRSNIFVDLNIMAITPFEGVSLEYAMIWLSGIDLSLLNSGTSVPQINNKDIEPLLFPLPPLPEQEKIVLKVEQLVKVCNELKGLINKNRLNQFFLTDVFVERAVF